MEQLLVTTKQIFVVAVVKIIGWDIVYAFQSFTMADVLMFQFNTSPLINTELY